MQHFSSRRACFKMKTKDLNTRETRRAGGGGRKRRSYSEDFKLKDKTQSAPVKINCWPHPCVVSSQQRQLAAWHTDYILFSISADHTVKWIRLTFFFPKVREGQIETGSEVKHENEAFWSKNWSSDEKWSHSGVFGQTGLSWCLGLTAGTMSRP